MADQTLPSWHRLATPDGRIGYFAYGSNMGVNKLRSRAGIIPSQSIAASLAEHALRFNLRGIPLIEPSFANLESEPGATCHGVLHIITIAEYRKLLATESRQYRTVEIEVTTIHGERTRAITLAAPTAARETPPSKRYLGLLQRGAEEHQLPASYQQWLSQHPFTYVPVVAETSTLVFGALIGIGTVGYRRIYKPLSRIYKRTNRTAPPRR